MKLHFTALLLILSLSAAAQSYCIRAGAGGSTGTTWSDAYSQLPSSLQRGATYYIAAGTYPGYNFDDPVSGSDYITIKKATTTEHGTGTGWDDEYANGQVVFTSSVGFSTPYWVFDGITGGGPSGWKTGLGFKIQVLSATSGSGIYIESSAHHIRLRHFEVQGNGGDGNSNPAQDLIWSDTDSRDITVSYAYLYDSGRCLFFYRSNNVTNEYVYCGRFESTPEQHAEIASVGENANWTIPMSTNVVFRHCIFTHSEGTGGLMMMGDGLIVYGCVFAPLDGNTLGGGNGVIGGWTGYPLLNMKFFNNTFIAVESQVMGIFDSRYGDKTGEFRNNLVYDSYIFQGYLDYLTHTHNHYVDVDTIDEPTGTTDTGDPFLNWVSGNFALNSNTDPGTPLPSPYDTDMYGKQRSSWTRGAIEFVSSPSAPNIQSNNIYATNTVLYSASAVASGQPTNWLATGLVELSIQANGLITGTPTSGPSTNTVTLMAYNATGSDTQTVLQVVYDAVGILSVSPNSYITIDTATNQSADFVWTLTNLVPATTVSGTVYNVSAPFSVLGSATYVLSNNMVNITSRYSPTSIGTNLGQFAFSGNSANEITNNVYCRAYPVFYEQTYPATNGLIVSPFISSNYVWQVNDSANDYTQGGVAIFGFYTNVPGVLRLRYTAATNGTVADSFFVGVRFIPVAGSNVCDVYPNGENFGTNYVHQRGATGVADQPATWSTNHLFPVSSGITPIYFIGREPNCLLGQIFTEFSSTVGPMTITSGDARGTNGITFTNYTIWTDITAEYWGATNLPTGLSRATNYIYGTPTVSVTNAVGLFATNSGGNYDDKVVSFEIAAPAAVPAAANKLNVGTAVLR